jgi:short-subunit dehydrogenase
LFAAQGWRVSTISLSETDPEILPAHPVRVATGDITDKHVRRRYVEETISQFGRIDALINNAGIGLYASPSCLSIDLFRRLFEVNVAAPLALAQLVIPIMRRQGAGVIVNIGSVAGSVSLPWASGYCASKFAMHALSDSLRRELRGHGIRVVKICPGIVDTRFRERGLGGSAPENVKRLRRVVSPESVASAIFRAVQSPSSSTVYVPRIGRLFCAIQNCFPSVMDWYLNRLSKDSHGLDLSRPEATRSQALD